MNQICRRHEIHRTATHEAGHAVIGYVLGIKVQRISIVQQGASAGHVFGRASLSVCQRVTAEGVAMRIQ